MATPADMLARLMAEQMQKTGTPTNNVETTTAPAEQPNQTAEIIRLPVWPDSVRGIPNIALRSALFGAIRRGARPYLEQKEIHAQNGVFIRYTGIRLDQADLDVWEAVLQICRFQNLGTQCRTNAYQLLKLLEKTDTGKNRTTLSRRLSRIKATALEVQVDAYSYEGSLIDEVYRDKETLEYVIRLNPKLTVFFESDQFTQVDWKLRHALDGKPLAQWLYGYYASHAKPYPVKIETLLKLSGSENTEPRSSRQKVRKALQAITQACEDAGQSFTFSIEGNLVEVKKSGTKSQKRHLKKKT